MPGSLGSSCFNSLPSILPKKLICISPYNLTQKPKSLISNLYLVLFSADDSAKQLIFHSQSRKNRDLTSCAIIGAHSESRTILELLIKAKLFRKTIHMINECFITCFFKSFIFVFLNYFAYVLGYSHRSVITAR